REEVFYCHRGRHPVLMRIKTGVTKDGAIKAMHFKSYLDGGGYGSYGVASTYYTGALQTVTYNVENYKFEGLRCFTNKPPCGPKRGHGTPQPRFALEVHLDKIADKIATGQGSAPVLDTVVAEALGIARNDRRIVFAETYLTRVELGSYSSRVTLMMVNAEIQAAERARQILAKAAAEKLGVPPDRLPF